MSSHLSEIEFADLIRVHHARVFGFIRSLVLDANDAQDVFQETVLALWQQQTTFDASRDFGAWAIGVARNKAFDYFKSKRQGSVHLSDDVLQMLAARQEASEEAEQLALRDKALQLCMKGLSDPHRSLLQRCYEGKESVAQVATSMARTPAGIYSTLRHVRMKLLDCVRGKLKREVDHG